MKKTPCITTSISNIHPRTDIATKNIITTYFLTRWPSGGLRGCLQAGPRLLGHRRALPGALLPAALLPGPRAHVPRQGGEGDALAQGLWHLPEPGGGARVLPAGHPWPDPEVLVGPLWKATHLTWSTGGTCDLNFVQTILWWPTFAQIVALVSICFIIISTVVLTLNTLPYFQVTMFTTLWKPRRVIIQSYSELNNSYTLSRVQMGSCSWCILISLLLFQDRPWYIFDLSVYYSLEIALDT